MVDEFGLAATAPAAAQPRRGNASRQWRPARSAL